MKASGDPRYRLFSRTRPEDGNGSGASKAPTVVGTLFRLATAKLSNNPAEILRFFAFSLLFSAFSLIALLFAARDKSGPWDMALQQLACRLYAIHFPAAWQKHLGAFLACLAACLLLFLFLAEIPRILRNERGRKASTLGLRETILGCLLMLLLLALFYSLGASVFVLLPIMLIPLLGAALLELPAAAALWFTTNALVLRESTMLYYYFNTNTEPPVPLSLLAVAGAIPSLILFAYIRQQKQVETSPRSPGRWPLAERFVLIGALLASITVISFFSADYAGRCIAQILPLSEQNATSLSAIRFQLEQAFSVESIDAGNMKLARFLLRHAAISGQNLYLFKKNETSDPGAGVTLSYSLTIGAVASSHDANQIVVARDLRSMRQEQRKPISDLLKTLALGFQDEMYPGLPIYTTAFHSSDRYPPEDPLYGGSDSLPVYDKATAAYSTADSNFGFVLMAIPMGFEHREAIAARESRAAAVQLFPWLFFGSLFFASVFLFVISKRERLRRQLIQAEERARINHEAHNRISNRLSALAIRAESASTNPEEAKILLENLPETLRNAVSDLKNVVLGIESSGAVPLEAAARKACERRSEEHRLDIALSFALPHGYQASAKAQEILISCLEESLGNVAKHACARNVFVRIESADTLGRMVIKDDGSGFSPPEHLDSLVEEGHLGLAGIARRVAELGGQLHIDSLPGKGTALEITWIL